MRKLIPLLLTVLLFTLICGVACADVYVLDSIYASIDVGESFPVVLRPDHLSVFETWLTAREKTVEAVTADFEKRGVLLQCWNEEGDMCFELTAVQSEQSQLIFDVNEQSTAVRRSYRLVHYPRNEIAGYDFSAADWKNTDNGRFLVLKYNRRDMGETLYRGLMRRTIRNGYEISLDLQVYGRSVTNKDTVALNNLMNSFQFIQIQPMPPAASAQIDITETPPTETNDPSFKLKGTAAVGVKLTAVIMGLSSPDPIVLETTTDKSGKFEMPITLPKEGVFLITVTGEHQGEEVIELAYPVTYQRTLLTVNVTSQVPEVVTGSELSITGTSEPGASIQVFLNSEAVEQKHVTAAGKFKIDFNLNEEGAYEIGIVFSQKGLADRRLTYTVIRQWSDADTLKQLQQEAIKPAYATLINKMEGYEGRIMGYRAYLIGVSNSGDEWIAQMALTKNKDQYSGIILVVCPEEPSFSIGQRVTMYGTCVGMSLGNYGVDGEADTESYPCFDLLLFVDEES
ncbi:MAG: hypothetical protein PHI98_10245 [Eubacteriales bacterium]|nr:hypothetical protein [Eubacteriales bacterium]